MIYGVKIENVRQDKITRIIDRHELSHLLKQYVLTEAGRVFDPKTDKVELDFIEETEGSPSYNVGKRVVVRLTLDVSDVPAPPPPPVDEDTARR